MSLNAIQILIGNTVFLHDPSILQMEFWTESYDDPPVGGSFIPIDTTSLLVSGASANTWMIPIVAAAIGVTVLCLDEINT